MWQMGDSQKWERGSWRQPANDRGKSEEPRAPHWAKNMRRAGEAFWEAAGAVEKRQQWSARIRRVNTRLFARAGEEALTRQKRRHPGKEKREGHAKKVAGAQPKRQKSMGREDPQRYADRNRASG